MELSDEKLIQELSRRFAKSRKAFSDLSVVNHKLLEMNERLERSESLKSNFLSNIRNEIINPLNSIIGLAGQLSIIGSENAEIVSISSLISAEANGLDFQLRNIFIAAELEAGEITHCCTRVHLFQVMNGLLDSFQHAAARKSVSLSLETGFAEKTIAVIDFEKVQLAVSNLLSNAIEYSPDGSAVELFCSIGGDGTLQISVQDHGIGIAEKDHKRIFDRFVQLETGTTKSHQGHGLGLSIAKALVDFMQGSITVASVPGEGSRFTIFIPPCSILDDKESFSEAGNLFIFDDMSEV